MIEVAVTVGVPREGSRLIATDNGNYWRCDRSHQIGESHYIEGSHKGEGEK